MTPPALSIGLARDEERQAIFALRHEVYARELRQHAQNPAGMLTDRLDAHNVYLVARRGLEIAGYVSVTPPGHGYSIDKYIARDGIPSPIDDRTYEVRLLTVRRDVRGGTLALLLMLAALRWIQERGGTRIIALGRRQVLPLYHKVGLEPLDIVVRSGDVEYALMSATVESFAAGIERWRHVLQRGLRDVAEASSLAPALTSPGGARR